MRSVADSEEEGKPTPAGLLLAAHGKPPDICTGNSLNHTTMMKENKDKEGDGGGEGEAKKKWRRKRNKKG